MLLEACGCALKDDVADTEVTVFCLSLTEVRGVVDAETASAPPPLELLLPIATSAVDVCAAFSEEKRGGQQMLSVI